MGILISIDNGDLQISGGGKSGQLQFNRGSVDWDAVCKDGFDDNAGDVACRQLGCAQSSDVYTYTYCSSYISNNIVVKLFAMHAHH